ncbi:hypothetical protein [Saccharolobus sp. A20]|nr:hypothetical protein [Sulfolobus sp. A20]
MSKKRQASPFRAGRKSRNSIKGGESSPLKVEIKLDNKVFYKVR